MAGGVGLRHTQSSKEAVQRKLQKNHLHVWPVYVPVSHVAVSHICLSPGLAGVGVRALHPEHVLVCPCLPSPRSLQQPRNHDLCVVTMSPTFMSGAGQTCRAVALDLLRGFGLVPSSQGCDWLCTPSPLLQSVPGHWGHACWNQIPVHSAGGGGGGRRGTVSEPLLPNLHS